MKLYFMNEVTSMFWIPKQMGSNIKSTQTSMAKNLGDFNAIMQIAKVLSCNKMEKKTQSKTSSSSLLYQNT